MHSTDHSHKAIITCAITGVLTDPGQHHVPVTPEQLAQEARRAYDAGAAVVHVHFRNQEPGKGHLPSWDPQVARDCVQAMRDLMEQSKGGWRTLVWLGGVAGSAGAAISWAMNHVKVN